MRGEGHQGEPQAGREEEAGAEGAPQSGVTLPPQPLLGKGRTGVATAVKQPYQPQQGGRAATGAAADPKAAPGSSVAATVHKSATQVGEGSEDAVDPNGSSDEHDDVHSDDDVPEGDDADDASSSAFRR